MTRTIALLLAALASLPGMAMAKTVISRSKGADHVADIGQFRRQTLSVKRGDLVKVQLDAPIDSRARFIVSGQFGRQGVGFVPLSNQANGVRLLKVRPGSATFKIGKGVAKGDPIQITVRPYGISDQVVPLKVE
jgi:hypothetical protein